MKPPEPPIPLPLRIWRGLRDPLGYLQDAERLGDVVSLRSNRTFAVFHPDHVNHVLVNNSRNYQKGEKYRNALAPLMGTGLFTSEGPFWLRQRRLAQGAFQKAQMPHFADIIGECSADLVRDWEAIATDGGTLDLRRQLVIATLRITVRNLFEAEPDMAKIEPAVAEAGEQIHFGTQFLPVHLPKWVPTPKRRRFAAAMSTIDEFIYAVLRERRQAQAAQGHLIDLLIAARDEGGDGMTDLQLRDELATMLIAGHDTVTDLIVWTLVVLSRYPELKRSLREEVRGAAGSDGVTFESLKKMDLLMRVLHESLRLYPPGWAFARTAHARDDLGGFEIPAGAVVVLSPYAMHRSPRYWDRPEVFDPDRFLPERSAGRPRFTYFPFGGGQRQCMGQGLALLEAPLILAAILHRLDFEIEKPEEIVASPRISLRPKGVVRLKPYIGNRA
jgi:cytochrome P450